MCHSVEPTIKTMMKKNKLHALSTVALMLGMISTLLIHQQAKGEHADAKQAVPAPEMIIRFADQKLVGTYKLNPKGSEILKKLITRNPDEVAPGGLALEPHGRILIQQHEYLLEPDEIILTGRQETKIWNHKGIMELLVQHAVKQP